MTENFQKGWKTLLEKEKLLVTSTFSISHSVFKRPVVLTCKNQGLFGNELNKSTTCVCQLSNVWCLIEDKKSKLKKGHNSGRKMHFEFPPLTVPIALQTMNTYFELRVNIFNNKRDLTKCHSFCIMKTGNSNTIAIAIPRVFSENSQAKKYDLGFSREKLRTVIYMDNGLYTKLGRKIMTQNLRTSSRKHIYLHKPDLELFPYICDFLFHKKYVYSSLLDPLT